MSDMHINFHIWAKRDGTHFDFSGFVGRIALLRDAAATFVSFSHSQAMLTLDLSRGYV